MIKDDLNNLSNRALWRLLDDSHQHYSNDKMANFYVRTIKEILTKRPCAEVLNFKTPFPKPH